MELAIQQSHLLSAVTQAACVAGSQELYQEFSSSALS
jgi:hypothetical protein